MTCCVATLRSTRCTSPQSTTMKRPCASRWSTPTCAESVPLAGLPIAGLPTARCWRLVCAATRQSSDSLLAYSSASDVRRTASCDGACDAFPTAFPTAMHRFKRIQGEHLAFTQTARVRILPRQSKGFAFFSTRNAGH